MKLVVAITELAVYDCEVQVSNTVVGLYPDSADDGEIIREVLIGYGSKFLSKPPSSVYTFVKVDEVWYAISGRILIENVPNEPVGFLGKNTVDLC